jgi:hypothetical protein
MLGGGGARRSSPSPLPSGCRRVILVRSAGFHMNKAQPATVELSAIAVAASPPPPELGAGKGRRYRTDAREGGM